MFARFVALHTLGGICTLEIATATSLVSLLLPDARWEESLLSTIRE